MKKAYGGTINPFNLTAAQRSVLSHVIEVHEDLEDPETEKFEVAFVAARATRLLRHLDVALSQAGEVGEKLTCLRARTCGLSSDFWSWEAAARLPHLALMITAASTPLEIMFALIEADKLAVLLEGDDLATFSSQVKELLERVDPNILSLVAPRAAKFLETQNPAGTWRGVWVYLTSC